MSLNRNILSLLQSLDPKRESDDLQLIYPVDSERAELLVSTRADNYSAATIARAVEDCDVHLVNLNITSVRTLNGDLVIALRVNGRSADAVARSLERYGYEVLAKSGDGRSVSEQEGRLRVAELLHILDI